MDIITFLLIWGIVGIFIARWLISYFENGPTPDTTFGNALQLLAVTFVGGPFVWILVAMVIIWTLIENRRIDKIVKRL